MSFSLLTLLARKTRDEIYAAGLAVAQGVGLTTTSWEPGDPTRSDYHYLAEILANLEGVVVQWIEAAYGDFVGDDWAGLWAKEGYDVDQVEATHAETEVTITNNGGGYYEIKEGQLTFKNTSSGKTYHNTSAGILDVGPGTTVTLDVIADEAGSASSATAGEIDDLVTSLGDNDNLVVSNATAATGTDLEATPALVARARASLGALSPNGPRDAYVYVATTPEFTGITTVTKARPYDDSDTGDVLLYLAGPSGAISAGDRDAVEAAIVQNATPLCITPTVESAANVVVPVTYTVWVYSGISKTTDEVKDAVAEALAVMIAARPIGGDVVPPAAGKIYLSLIEATIRQALAPHCFAVTVAAPAGDTTLAANEVAVLGTVTGTVNFVEDP